MRINVYVNDKEYAHIKLQEDGYMRSLVQKDMRIYTPDKQTMRIVPEAPKDKVFFVKETEIKMTCRVCKGLLDTRNRCSNKKCKQFMK